MPASIHIVLHKQNIRAFLKSQELVSAMTPIAERIRSAADAGSEAGGHEVRVLNGSDRASLIIATVTPEAMVAEMTDRNLTRAMEAGRG
jgi:hypothetical protein